MTYNAHTTGFAVNRETQKPEIVDFSCAIGSSRASEIGDAGELVKIIVNVRGGCLR